MQLDLFTAVLEDLAADADRVNACLEATMEEDGQIAVERYVLPVPAQPGQACNNSRRRQIRADALRNFSGKADGLAKGWMRMD